NFFGIRVQEPFVDRLAFREDSPSPLWNSSIVFRDVRPEDESCYRCLFSGHPDEPPESTSSSPDSRHDGDTTTVHKHEGPSAVTEEPPLTERSFTSPFPTDHWIVMAIILLVVVLLFVFSVRWSVLAR
ncbi:hypothetical protein CRUP_010071, partial [Coryphaenoides rupestris]